MREGVREREREIDAYVYELPELKIAEIIGGESD